MGRRDLTAAAKKHGRSDRWSTGSGTWDIIALLFDVFPGIRDEKIIAAALASMLATGPALAEGEIRIAEQFGISYLPLQVMRQQNLIEQAGKRQGLEIRVAWSRHASGGLMNEAMLDGALDIGARARRHCF